jgi:uncharacterized protein YidB (DUF937 family)
MGLLDDLLGGLAGQAMGQQGGQQLPRGGSGGGGMPQILMALMPVVLSMLANRGASGAPGRAANASGGGGLGDILGQVLGAGAGGGPAAGGLGDLLDQVRRSGFGEQADSWVARGPNNPIPPDAMTQIFGHDGLERISRQAGISEDEATRGLAELLPEMVDRVTPDGSVPDGDALANSVDDFARRLGLGSR